MRASTSFGSLPSTSFDQSGDFAEEEFNRYKQLKELMKKDQLEDLELFVELKNLKVRFEKWMGDTSL